MNEKMVYQSQVLDILRKQMLNEENKMRAFMENEETEGKRSARSRIHLLEKLREEIQKL